MKFLLLLYKLNIADFIIKTNYFLFIYCSNVLQLCETQLIVAIFIIIIIIIIIISSSSSSSSSRRTDRWVHSQQNADRWLFVHTWIVHGIDDCYQLTRTFGGFSAQCLSKLFLKEFTALLVTTSFGRAFQVAVILIG